jgi:folylpolyglutamate synthase/dihydropteroate synthase
MTDGVAAAVDLALARARPGDLICATGSLFVVAEVTAYLKGVAQEEYSGH